jgi:serine/threonine-protein kinase
VDRRTDIWSLGVVLHEMIAGKLPFPGDYEQAIVYGILNEQPEPLTALRTGVPMELERIVNKCLEKDRNNRYQHVDEVVVDLQRIEVEPVGKTTKVRPIPQPTSAKTITPLAAGAIAALAGVAGVVLGLLGSLMFFDRSSEELGLVQHRTELLDLVLDDDAPLFPRASGTYAFGQKSIALSPNGEELVYVSETADGSSMLYRRRLTEKASYPIEDTEGGMAPFFSPDGQWIGFLRSQRVHKVSVQTGLVEPLCEAIVVKGFDWDAENERILYLHHDGNVLAACSVFGGIADTLFVPPYWAHYPVLLPNGAILMTDYYGRFLTVFSPDTGESRNLRIEGVGAGIGNLSYLHTGHLLFAHKGSLKAAPFDTDRMVFTGPAVTVANDLRVEQVLHEGHFDVSMDGKLIYLEGDAVDLGQLVWATETSEEPLEDNVRLFGQFEISPDGSRAAVVVLEENWHIWVFDLQGGYPRRLTNEGNNIWPRWAPDGEHVLFSSDRFTGERWDLFMVRADGAGGSEPLAFSEETHRTQPQGRMPDGRVLIGGTDSLGGWVGAVYPDPDSALAVFRLRREWGHTFSPDGDYWAYNASHEGAWGVYAGPYDRRGPELKVSPGPGIVHDWQNDRIYYLEAQQRGSRIMAARVEASPTLRVHRAEVALQRPFVQLIGRSFDVSPDGKRFLVVKSQEEGRARTRLRVVTNFFEELKRLAPVDN